MKNRQPPAPILVQQGKGRAGRFLRALQALEQAFDEVCFPRPEVADERDDVVRHERLRPGARESDRLSDAIGSEGSHGKSDG